MEQKSGSEFSFPVAKTPRLETRLLELPKEIKDMEIKLYKTKAGQIKDNIKIEEIKKETPNDFRSSPRYQILKEKQENVEEILKLGAIELRFLNNYFTACKAVSRMI